MLSESSRENGLRGAATIDPCTSLRPDLRSIADRSEEETNGNA
jgi:hypothetical protein